MPGAGVAPCRRPQAGLLDSLREAGARQQVNVLADRIAAPPLARAGVTVVSPAPGWLHPDHEPQAKPWSGNRQKTEEVSHRAVPLPRMRNGPGFLSACGR